MTTFTEQQLASRFGVTVQQVRAAHAQNAQVLRGMLAKAESTGKKVNGYTAAQLRDMAEGSERRAKGQK